MPATTQLAILAAETWSVDQSAFTVVSAVRVDGVPDWSRLVEAVDVTLARHDVLTWRLDLNDSYHVVAYGGRCGHGAAYTIEQVDLSEAAPAAAETVVNLRLHRERRRVIGVFDAASRPYTRMILFRLGRTSTVGESGICALVTHHVFVDEHSTELIWNEIFQRAVGRYFVDNYDRRYAEWAAASVSESARVAAGLAARDLIERLRAVALGSIGAESSGIPTDVAGSPLRFRIPFDLDAAALVQAKRLAVPVSAVYATALARAVCARANRQSLAVSMPMTRRTDLADLTVVGCYINAVPVLAESLDDNADPATAIYNWYDSAAFSSARAYADAEVVCAGIGSPPEISLSFEARGVRTANPIRWAAISPPDSPAKSPLAVFLSPGSRWAGGNGRLLWRMGVLTEPTAHALVADFLVNLAWCVDVEEENLGAS